MGRFSLIKFFVPEDHKFFEMLKGQAENSLKGATVFSEFAHDFPKLSEAQKKRALLQIKELEKHGDRQIHEIVDRMNKTFITPIDKEDIHELTILLDDVLDLVYTASDQIVRYKIRKATPCILNLSKIILSGMRETKNAVNELEKNRYSKEYLQMMHELEAKGDKIYHDALEELFAKEKDAIEIIKLKDIYGNLELVTDKLEDVAIVIENIVIKHA